MYGAGRAPHGKGEAQLFWAPSGNLVWVPSRWLLSARHLAYSPGKWVIVLSPGKFEPASAGEKVFPCASVSFPHFLVLADLLQIFGESRTDFGMQAGKGHRRLQVAQLVTTVKPLPLETVSQYLALSE